MLSLYLKSLHLFKRNPLGEQNIFIDFLLINQ